MAAADEPETIQKENYVLQLYDETKTYSTLHHKFSSRYYVPYQMSSEYFQELKYRGKINFKKS
jgi:hypothetical protein